MSVDNKYEAEAGWWVMGFLAAQSGVEPMSTLLSELHNSMESLFSDILHFVDIIIDLCNGLSSTFSNMETRLIYKIPGFHSWPVPSFVYKLLFPNSLCSSDSHGFSLYPNIILSHSWTCLLFWKDMCLPPPESGVGYSFLLVYNQYDQHNLVVVYSRYIQDLKWVPKTIESTKSCTHHVFFYIYFCILKSLK